MESTVRYDGSECIVNDMYKICGNYDDGYEVYLTEHDEEDCIPTQFESKDFEECLVWCINSSC